VGYANDEDTLRREFGSYTELDELETAGGHTDSGRHSEREQQREHGPNPGVLVGAAQFRGIWGHTIAGCRNRSRGEREWFYNHSLIVYIYVIKSSGITHAKRVRNDPTIVVYGPGWCAGKE